MTGDEIIAECNVIFGQRGVGEIGPENWLTWINSGILYMSTALCVYDKVDSVNVPKDHISVALPTDFVSFVDPWSNEGAVLASGSNETLVKVKPEDLPFQHLSGHTSHKVYYNRGVELYLFPSISESNRLYNLLYYAKAPKLSDATKTPVFPNEAYHFALVDFALSRAFASKVTEGTRMESAEYHYKKFYQQVVDIKTGKGGQPQGVAGG